MDGSTVEIGTGAGMSEEFRFGRGAVVAAGLGDAEAAADVAEAEAGIDRVAVVKPVEEAGVEAIAGAGGVDDGCRGCGCVVLLAVDDGGGAIGSLLDDDEGYALGEGVEGGDRVGFAGDGPGLGLVGEE